VSTKPGVTSRFRPPKFCFTCGVNRAAWHWPSVDYCYGCLPGGPFPAPSCERCGSPDYFSQGLCERCHPGSPHYIGQCKDCYAWGVYRGHQWRCRHCAWWASHNPVGDCRFCHRRLPIGERGACRLCIESARRIQQPGRDIDLDEGTRHGLQLFFANMPARRKLPLPAQSTRASRIVLDAEASVWEQPALFELAPDPEVLRQRATAQARDWSYRTDGIVFEHARQFGWSNRQTNQVRRSLKMLQILAPDGTTMVRATEVIRLRRYDAEGNIVSTLDVLDAAGLLIDDRTPHIDRYFDGKFAGLPPAMRTQLELWFDIMIHGSPIPPRRKPRDPATVKIQILGIAPFVTAWAEDGIESLAEISPELLLDSLPADAGKRHWAERGFRALFGILKGRNAIFADPTTGMPLTEPRRSTPLPADTETILAALNHSDPAVALATSIVAFHGLTNLQIRALQLTDIIDGRLTLPDGRVIPLAEPVRARLRTWLDHRATRWPRTMNPHLFVTMQTAPRLSAPSRQFPWLKAGISAQTLRTDRVLHEVQASGGDVRRISDLFGIGIESVARYLGVLDPDLSGHRPD